MLRPRRTRRVLVTGATGFLGRHIVHSPAADRWELVAPSSQALDLRDADAVMAQIRSWKPHVVIHAAYRKDDRASIVDASANVARATAAAGARLVHLSSDAVFPGRLAAYTERDAPRPLNDYGRHKAEAELAVAQVLPTALVVRTSLLVGLNELSPHELAVRAAISGQSDMVFFTDEIRSPVIVDDLAAALVEVVGRPEVSGILHIAGPDALSRAGLAELTAHRQGWDASRLRFGTITGSGLIRPTRVVLDSSRAAALGIRVRGPLDWPPRDA